MSLAQLSTSLLNVLTYVPIFRDWSYFFVAGLFWLSLNRYSRPYNCFAVIYHSSSYLGLLLSLEEYVLSAAVIVGRYLFLYIQAISEYLLANFNRLLCLGRYYFVIFSLITDFPVLTISELLLMIIKLLNLLLSFD